MYFVFKRFKREINLTDQIEEPFSCYMFVRVKNPTDVGYLYLSSLQYIYKIKKKMTHDNYFLVTPIDYKLISYFDVLQFNEFFDHSSLFF